MIKLGDTVSVSYGQTTKMWLASNGSMKHDPEFYGRHYIVMGFIPGKGWYTANNGTLKEMRNYIKSKM